MKNKKCDCKGGDIMNWRIGILLKNGKREAKNFETKEKCEEWLLTQIDKKEIKTSMIVNKKDIHDRFIEHWGE